MSRTIELSDKIGFQDVDWGAVPDRPGVYVIYDENETIYVGMAGRNGRGSLRNRLRDHASGQIVNMFAQYLFLDRVQFVSSNRIRHPREARAACRLYIHDRLSFRFAVTYDGAEARDAEGELKRLLSPSLNP